MRKVLVAILPLLTCVLWLTACGGASSGDPAAGATGKTATGITCIVEPVEAGVSSNDSDTGCFYYVTDSDGSHVPCTTALHEGGSASNLVDYSDQCANTTGRFYVYDFDNGNTYSCDSGDHTKAFCTELNNDPVTDALTLCPSPVFTYNALVNKDRAWQVADEEQDVNTTASPAQVTFTSKKSQTSIVSTSVDITAYAQYATPVIFASVRAEVNTSVVNSATASIGNEYSITLPPGRTAHGIYGVQVQITDGHLFSKDSSTQGSCAGLPQDYGTVTTYVPIAAGWCVWLDTQPASVCPTVS